MPDHARLQIARMQIAFARDYTRGLIADIDDGDWFLQPAQGVGHVAWQVGHLAVAEYGLGLFRQRGRREGDAELLPSAFRKQFAKGSIPEANAAEYPAPPEIRRVLDRVHERTLEELTGYAEAELDAPCEEPYAIFPTRLGALFFCSAHEMMHAGQLGLLRRLLGKPPLR